MRSRWKKKSTKSGKEPCTSSGRVDWLLVGTGDIVRKRVAAALASASHSRIAAICGRSRERARALADTLSVTDVFTDFDEALARADANAVYLATPVNVHIPQAIAAMKAGKHVLVEKPLGLSADECAEAVRVARQTGVTAGCAYYRRFFPRYAHARRMIDDGAFGKLLLIRMICRTWYEPAQDDPKRWRLTRSVSGGGPLADMGSHMIDQLVGLLGMPRSVFARVDNVVHLWEVEDQAVAWMTLSDDVPALASFHWNSRSWSHEFEIIGSDASLKWVPADTGKVVKAVGGEVEEVDLPNAENVHLPLVEDFVAAVAEGRSPRVDLAEAAKTNVIIDAIYESSRRGGEVAL